ncbi:MAG TPA: LacI family DNA-binding transcriptional regulator [Opitutaceae bacterium]
MERCTLTTIAQAARVSVSTVSYALRNHPKIPPETALRIQQLAAELGYKAHPSVAALMAHIRSARQPSSAEKIAFVWIEVAPTEANIPFNQQIIAGARARAVQLGYEMEEFWLAEPGMTSRRLGEILRTRGITGIVFSACDRKTGVQLEMDWPAHAMAIIGNARWNPELHRAGHYHYMGMQRVLHELELRGYRRPAVLLERVVNERAHRAWEAAFLVHHPLRSQAKTLLKPFSILDPKEVKPWCERVRPDAIIVTKPLFVEPLRAAIGAASSEIGYAVLDLLGGHGHLSGIDPVHSMVAANAVDLVVSQLFHNERGVPSEPKKLLFEGRWIEGRTLRQAPAQARA